jgi:hypothetical protein
MSFFEPPPPAPQPPEPPGVVRKPWWHAPRNELGVSTSVRLILARTENIAVALIDAVAYSTGIEFTLAVLRRLPREPDRFEHPFGRFGHGPRAAQERPPELLRFGVQFQDGRKATTLAPRPPCSLSAAAARRSRSPRGRSSPRAEAAAAPITTSRASGSGRSRPRAPCIRGRVAGGGHRAHAP